MASNIKMDLGTIKIDADPELLGEFVDRVISDGAFRKQFEDDPVAVLRARGVEIPEEMAKSINPVAIQQSLDKLIEGNEFQQASVMVQVRVATRPGTSPAVQVGVSVVVRSAVLVKVQTEKEFAEERMKNLRIDKIDPPSKP
jgi:hypothetical protein